MKIGFLTNCLGHLELPELAGWAAENGFDALEVGPSIRLDPDDFQAARAAGLEITALTFCRNFMCDDQAERDGLRSDLLARVQFAADMQIPRVTTSTGMIPGLTLEENVERCAPFLDSILGMAAGGGVEVCLENCPGTGNVAVSPYAWRLLFEAVAHENLRLCFDPSHLIWLFIDRYQAAEEFVDDIAYIHAKDTILDRAVLADRGVHMNSDYWRTTLPGAGETDWARLLSVLSDNGFDGTISIEHEDPLWMADDDDIRAGLLWAKAHLEKTINASEHQIGADNG